VWSRVYVGDVARAVLAALGTGWGAGQCLNIVEEQAAPMRLHYEQVIAAADASLELVRVPDEALPADLAVTGTISQHLMASPAKAREVLGWRAAADQQVLRRAVAWHLRHPPDDAGTDFSADDAALAAALA
jgi:nucleoside-diphosphate-sugar epimerase